MDEVTVIGGGLAGCEAAWALAERGFRVKLYEMKPKKYTPAHHYEGLAELVCSNSLKASRINSACGMLKAEMRMLGSLILEAADSAAVPAGGALAVNRERFSDYVTEKIKAHENISLISEEVTDFPRSNTIIATGPLTSDAFAEAIQKRCGSPLSFYDAAAPIVSAESIDMSKAFFATRYDKGEADYINCPMNKEQYEAFYNELVSAETVPLKEFEKLNVYEGCMPVEVLAKRGAKSLCYGCMKPVGLTDPNTGHRPWAAVQLRKENTEGSAYNLVGFQTNLKFPEQQRVFRMIPGLENAEFLRYGVMHRNTFLNSPGILNDRFMLKESDGVYFAGQMTGVEGYIESAMSGIVAGQSLARRLMGQEKLNLPKTTMCGALCSYVEAENADFQPMGANMGILPPLEEHIRDKQDRYLKIAERGLEDMRNAIENL
ncbi:MAG: methylenetetrahydrofolate--tRNA-(uracil(54)-C(5))-methyltransferase (FADH(2)-oxidizing) TrmFO [Ruminococcaceae bacterium]|nr:methylenetetrahydrofolate--tRNA-(uracil(54)-C(5))-methyltransferase (FADH(2)-oxidizing) TrmFO [Oscillospiraceae bacterium]